MIRLALLLLLPALPALAQDVHVRVTPGHAQAGPGNEDMTEFPTIQNALDHHPFAGPGGRVYIEIAPGTYNERIIVTQNHQNITLVGKGKTPGEVVITNSLNAKSAGGTFFTETAEINGDGFEADNLTFENTAGNTGQAVAAAVRADRAVFKHVRFLGHQDTLFADYGRQYYVECFITGGVDYIFGNAAAVFDKSELNSNGPGSVTAQSRTSPDQPTGYVILNSRITSSIDTAAAVPGMQLGNPGPAPQAPASPYNDGVVRGSSAPPPPNAPTLNDGVLRSPAPVPPPPPGPPKVRLGGAPPASPTILLGRPWRPYSRVVYLDDELPANLNPAGWNNWGKAANESTAWYAEYGSTGPGASPSTRVKWAHTLTAVEVNQFLPKNFLRGKDNWDPEAAAARLP